MKQLLDGHPSNRAFLDSLVRCEPSGIKGLADGINAAYAGRKDAPAVLPSGVSDSGLYLDAWELGCRMAQARLSNNAAFAWSCSRWMFVFEVALAHSIRIPHNTSMEPYLIELDDDFYEFYRDASGLDGDADTRRQGRLSKSDTASDPRPECRTVYRAVFDALEKIRSDHKYNDIAQRLPGRSLVYDVVYWRVLSHRMPDGQPIFPYKKPRRGTRR